MGGSVYYSTSMFKSIKPEKKQKIYTPPQHQAATAQQLPTITLYPSL